MIKSSNITDAPSAGILIIGNEILSGRTLDTNGNWLCDQLTSLGVRVNEIRTVPDIEEHIIQALSHMEPLHDFIFTTGGIGPTHDDITTQSVAKYFNIEVKLNTSAHKILIEKYGERLNEARLKMAFVPEGASLIKNNISFAPGFKIHNVYVLAGVPQIMKAMFNSIKTDINSNTNFYSVSLTGIFGEGDIATDLKDIQKNNPYVDIGSYPKFESNKVSCTITIRSIDMNKLNQAHKEIQILFNKNNIDLIDIIKI